MQELKGIWVNNQLEMNTSKHGFPWNMTWRQDYSNRILKSKYLNKPPLHSWRRNPTGVIQTKQDYTTSLEAPEPVASRNWKNI